MVSPFQEEKKKQQWPPDGRITVVLLHKLNSAGSPPQQADSTYPAPPPPHKKRHQFHTSAQSWCSTATHKSTFTSNKRTNKTHPSHQRKSSRRKTSSNILRNEHASLLFVLFNMCDESNQIQHEIQFKMTLVYGGPMPQRTRVARGP